MVELAKLSSSSTMNYVYLKSEMGILAISKEFISSSLMQTFSAFKPCQDNHKSKKLQSDWYRQANIFSN